MNIDEAKTDLSIQLEEKRRLGEDHQAKAIKLGIEALKVLQEHRELDICTFCKPLPGETED